MKPNLYGETLFWGRIFDRTDPRRRRITRRFLKWARTRFGLRISSTALLECSEAKDPAVRKAIRRAIRRARPRVIPTTWRVREVGREIHRRLGRGPKGFADSMHLAYAIVSGSRALVTWDIRDLARDWTRRFVREFCEERGWPAPLVGTPEEVKEWASRGIM